MKAGTRKGDSTPTRSGHDRFRKKKLQTDRLTGGGSLTEKPERGDWDRNREEKMGETPDKYASHNNSNLGGSGGYDHMIPSGNLFDKKRFPLCFLISETNFLQVIE